MSQTARFILKLSCPDQAGIVHAVTGFLLEQGGNIVTSHQHGDADRRGAVGMGQLAEADRVGGRVTDLRDRGRARQQGQDHEHGHREGERAGAGGHQGASHVGGQITSGAGQDRTARARFAPFVEQPRRTSASAA